MHRPPALVNGSSIKCLVPGMRNGGWLTWRAGRGWFSTRPQDLLRRFRRNFDLLVSVFIHVSLDQIEHLRDHFGSQPKRRTCAHNEHQGEAELQSNVCFGMVLKLEGGTASLVPLAEL